MTWTIVCIAITLICALALWRLVNMVQSTAWALSAVTAKDALLQNYYLGLYTAPAGALTPAILDAGFGGGGLTEVTAVQLNGYARILLGVGSKAAVLGVGTVSYGTQTFAFTGAGTGTTILGWFVATGAVIGAGSIIVAQQETSVTPPAVANTYSVGPFVITDQAIP